VSVFTRIAFWLGADARRRSRVAAAVLVSGVALVAAIWFSGREDVPVARLQRQFREAGRAYAEGRMPEAVRLYEEMVRGGFASVEVFFNLGNAHIKEGRLGSAVLNYRKAWRLAPRDPDIRANLRLALQAAGASEADLSGAEIVFTNLSERELAMVTMAAWWTTCLLISLAILVRNRRWPLLRLAAVMGAVAVVGILGLWTWRGFERHPELVVLHDTQNALHAPQAAATPRFPLPEGSVVRAREYQGEWVRVSHGQLAGWIRRAACAPVLLEAPGR
jgi:hypothetical protein